ncbi:MAG TPA: phage/plasmid primase, P4 family [Micromonosporaceae bacterium]|nr:phage/plasmid primase, P4 family [Micromonosporaceae bacterium]
MASDAGPVADLAHARQWLAILHGDAPGLTHICSTDDWAGRAFADLGAAINYVRYLDTEGREGIYVRVSTLRAALPPGRRGGAADTQALPALWADLDLAGPGHEETNLPPDEQAGRKVITVSGLPDPTLWIHSGGGLYPIWLLDQPWTITDDQFDHARRLAADWQRVIEHATASLGWRYGRGVGDLARVLRLPGTVNRKAGLTRPCRIIDATDTRYSVEQLDRVLAAAVERIAPPADSRIVNPAGGIVAPSTNSPAGQRVTAPGDGPGDDYNARGPAWPAILEPHGWRVHYQQDDVTYWTRPGKTTGTSASTNALGTDRLHVFSTNATPFEAGQSYHRFAAYALLDHAGDYRAAARQLGEQGYGAPLPDLAAEQADNLAALLGPGAAGMSTGTPATPPRKAAGGPPSAYFRDGSLLVETLSSAILARHPCALTREHKVAVYADGVYRLDTLALSAAVAELLGDRFSPRHRGTVAEFIAARLYLDRRFLPERVAAPLLNLRNGMLDLLTGQLESHDPSHLSAVQLPIQWQPDATCPRYESWLTEVIPDQVDDLEEIAGTMLDPSRTPTRALFAFGPARSGKSTFLRLLAAIAGAPNTSAVTLHQLVDNRFAAANVYGKILNSAADISSAHVEDIGIFKMMTGEDPIHADRKYGGQFTFTNRALFAFSANTLPTVGESSRAYVERIKPFAFESSFAGREDPQVEVAMMSELPGILARWVAAYRRLVGRGRPLDTPQKVRNEFEERSDRVRQWVADCCELTGNLPPTGALLPPTEVASRRWLARAFNDWARDQGSAPMGERKILDRLTSIDGVVEVRNAVDKSRGLNIRVTGGHTHSDLLGGRSGRNG